MNSMAYSNFKVLFLLSKVAFIGLVTITVAIISIYS